MQKNIFSLIIYLIFFLALPLSVFAQQNDLLEEDSEGVFVVGALMKVITTVESEVALQFSFSATSMSEHINLPQNVKKRTGDDSVPGLIRITGGSMEVMIDIENTFLEENFDEGKVKIYDFTLDAEGEGSSIVLLHEASERSFTLAIGAKAEILSGENIYYFTKNVLSANYL